MRLAVFLIKKFFQGERRREGEAMTFVCLDRLVKRCRKPLPLSLSR